ncbi:tellurite resistance TerB family protein [Candidatus Synechococcus spongiarum]|uniref:tellurite resistance TerB family protein n=1 Tax=Candidatus Synechococcus spongiarum TaxID=431041 RepID=UPI0004700D14|nr:tellurite resistance TerB family protein [Candidatus Synechococcus spongiarum]
MDTKTAFAAVGHCAVWSDLDTSDVERNAFFEELNARHPYNTLEEAEWAALVDQLWDRHRKDGREALLAEATTALSPGQQLTAFAVACKIVASDGEVNHDEVNFLIRLAEINGLNILESRTILSVMQILCQDALA